MCVCVCGLLSVPQGCKGLIYSLFNLHKSPLGFPGGSVGKEPACNARDARDLGSILGREDPLEAGTATHSGILAWRIPWTEEPGGLQSRGHKESDTTEATEHSTANHE